MKFEPIKPAPPVTRRFIRKKTGRVFRRRLFANA
jgi:hypothetical protein